MISILLVLGSAWADAPACIITSIPSSPYKPGLSKYWAQDQIGADLAKDLIDKSRDQVRPRRVKVVNMDGGIDTEFVTARLDGRAKLKTPTFGFGKDHGTKVVNLIGGDGPYGVGHPSYTTIVDNISIENNQNKINESEFKEYASFTTDVYAQLERNKEYQDILKELANQYSAQEAYDKMVSSGTSANSAARYAYGSRSTAYSSGFGIPHTPENAELMTKLTQITQAARQGLMADLKNKNSKRLKAIEKVERQQDPGLYQLGGLPEKIGRIRRTKPDIVSLEVHTLPALSTNSEVAQKAISDLSSRHLVVACAGNYGSTDADAKSAPAASEKLVVVGSTTPSGLLSSFSNGGPSLSVVAPSDTYLASKGVHESAFGGTSGAQPLVSGSLSNAIAILGPLNSAEAKTLIKKTATPLKHLKESENGVGLINSYRLTAAAIRLRKQGWPKNKEQLLATDSIFDFSKEGGEFMAEAKPFIGKSDCASIEKAIVLYRKAFLLTANPDAAKWLAELYRKLGFDEDAQFYHALSISDLKERRSFYRSALKSGEPVEIRNKFNLSEPASVK